MIITNSKKILILTFFLLIGFIYADEGKNDQESDSGKLPDKLIAIEIPHDEFTPEGEKYPPFNQTAFLISSSGVAVSYIGNRMPPSILNLLSIYKGKETPILPLLSYRGFVIFKLRFIHKTPCFKLADKLPENKSSITHIGFIKDKIKRKNTRLSNQFKISSPILLSSSFSSSSPPSFEDSFSVGTYMIRRMIEVMMIPIVRIT